MASGGGGTVPKAYQPTGSPTQDFNQQGLMNNAYGNIMSYTNDLLPGFKSIADNILSNPYAESATQQAAQTAQLGQQVGQQGLQGAQSVYGAGQQGFNQIAPQQLWAAMQMYGMGNQQAQAGNSLIGTQMNQLLPQQLQAAQSVYGMGDQLAQGGQSLMNTEFNSVLPGQLGAANAQYGIGNMDMSLINPILQAAFDPQHALYSRDMSQLMQQTNAQSAASGLGGSPYAAGLAGDQARNFQIDWENNQLSRMLQGAGGASGLGGAAQSAYAGGATTAGNAIQGGLSTLAGAYAPAQQAYMNAQGMQNNATTTAEGIVNGAYTGAQNSFMGGSNLDRAAMDTYGQSAGLFGDALGMGQSALNTLQTSGMLPYETQNAMQLNNMGAWGAYSQGVNNALEPTFNYANASNNYLKVGQGATALNQAAQQQQFQQNQSVWSGLGQIAGNLFGNIASSPFQIFGKGGGGGGGMGFGGDTSDAMALI